MLGLGLGLGIGGGGIASGGPLAIFGATLVLDLDSRNGVTQASSLVTAMADQSGKGNNSTAAGAARPGYSASGGVNGLPKLTFTGTQFMTGANSPVASGATRTVYAVATPGAVASIAVFTNCTSSPYATFLGNPGAGPFTYSDGAVSSETCTSNPASGVHLYVWKFTVGSLCTYILDGTSQTISGTVATTDTGTAGYIAWSNSAGQGWQGDGYRIVEVAGISTTQQDAAMRSYCQSLYGTP